MLATRWNAASTANPTANPTVNPTATATATPTSTPTAHPVQVDYFSVLKAKGIAPMDLGTLKANLDERTRQLPTLFCHHHFLRASTMCHTHTRAVCRAVLGARTCWLLTGACDPMFAPMHGS